MKLRLASLIRSSRRRGKAGLGLGLAVSFGIIRRHGGSIDVDSNEGNGTEFRITLPVATTAANTCLVDNQSVTPSISIVTPASKSKILIVDDEDFVRELLGEILESEDCEVFAASDGPEALELLHKHTFDGVLTDVGMPGMSGWELAEEIRRTDETIPIAVITGWGEAVGSDEQKAAGVDWVIAKPFTADRISELVREIDRLKSQNQTKRSLTHAA